MVPFHCSSTVAKSNVPRTPHLSGPIGPIRSVRYMTAFLCTLLATLLLMACTDSSSERVAYHSGRGDEYARQGRFREALIEYKNASLASPQDASLHWRLAQAALEWRNLGIALAELQQVTRLDSTHIEAKHHLGQLYLARGQRDQAANLAGDLVKHRSDSPLGYQLQAEISLLSGKVQEALHQFHQAIDRDPANVALMLTIGNLSMMQPDLEQARHWYDRALAVAPGSTDVHVARGSYFWLTGQAQTGEEEFRRAIETSSNREATRMDVARQYLALGRTAAAEQELAALIADMNSQQARALLAELKLEANRPWEAKPLTAAMSQVKGPGQDLLTTYLDGRIALAERRFDDARTLFTAVLQEDPGVAPASSYLGIIELIQGAREPGEQRLREAIRLTPNDPRPHLVLADLYLKEDQGPQAEEEALAVLRHQPWNLQAALLFGDSHAIRDHWAKAEDSYRAIAEHFSSSAEGYLRLATLKRRQGLTGAAAEYLAQAVRVAPQDSTIKGDYLLALNELGQNAKADRILNQYLATMPRDPGNWIAAGRLHAARQEGMRAEDSFSRAVTLAPDDPLIAYQLCRFYLTTGQRVKARRCLERTIDMDGSVAGIHTSLGTLSASEGRLDDANRHYRLALAQMPTDLVAMNNLAAILADGGNPEEGLRLARRALALAPWAPAVLDTAGWICFKNGLIEEARSLMANAVAKLPDDPVVQYHYGMVLSAQGDKKLAATYLREALAASKQFAGSDEALATLRVIE